MVEFDSVVCLSAAFITKYNRLSYEIIIRVALTFFNTFNNVDIHTEQRKTGTQFQSHIAMAQYENERARDSFL